MSYSELRQAAALGIKAKGLTREGLDIAKRAAAGLLEHVERWESMPLKELLREQEEVLGLCGIMDMYFVFTGLISTQDRQLLEEWDRLYKAIPDGGIARLDRLGGKIARYRLANSEISEMSSSAAGSRWDKLSKVKQWAFDQRAKNPKPTRASVIRNIEAEVVKRAKEAGEPLSGSQESRLATITRWFRDAGIK